MDAMLVESAAGTSYSSVTGPAYHHRDRYAYDADPCSSSTQHYSNPGLSQVEWIKDDSIDGENKDGVEQPTAAHMHLSEWLAVQQLDDGSGHDVDVDPEDDVPESMVASSSSASAWSRAESRVASTSVDSLGLHHISVSLGAADITSSAGASPPISYGCTDFSPDSKGTQHELSELDITQLPPLSGTLLNWKSPSAYYSTLDEDMIASLLSQKRPRDVELEELVGKYKRRRRMPRVWERE